MTNQDRFREFLYASGFTIQKAFPDWYSKIYEVEDKTILIDETEDKNTFVFPAGRQGYSGFFCALDFDKNGNFMEHYCGE
jgi:hypothetical protein